MKKINLVSIVVLCIVMLAGCAGEPNQEVNIVPQPQSVTVAGGGFILSPKTVINVVKGADDLTPACTFLSTLTEKSFGEALKVEYGEKCSEYQCRSFYEIRCLRFGREQESYRYSWRKLEGCILRHAEFATDDASRDRERGENEPA